MLNGEEFFFYPNKLPASSNCFVTLKTNKQNPTNQHPSPQIHMLKKNYFHSTAALLVVKVFIQLPAPLHIYSKTGYCRCVRSHLQVSDGRQGWPFDSTDVGGEKGHWHSGELLMQAGHGLVLHVTRKGEAELEHWRRRKEVKLPLFREIPQNSI